MSKLSWWKTSCAAFLVCAVTAIASSAQTFTTLLSFDNTDGYDPYAGLVQATDGNLYGTTTFGGANGYGAVFKISTSGTLTTLYSFCSQAHCPDGGQPFAGLVQATDGNLYGTTDYSGANGDGGTVYKITPTGTLAILYSFCSQTNCTDGDGSVAGLVQATDGNFYGTTEGGGANDNAGTVFKITPGGTLTTLYSFCSATGCVDGRNPYASLIQAADGNFYGTTVAGGVNGVGTVFRITPSGNLRTLYSFCSKGGSHCTDGDSPQAGLIEAADGNFYGTTWGGGEHTVGTVFKITPDGSLTTLYAFCSQSGCIDGANPLAALVQATDGNFYGATFYDGADGYGTLFEITPSGTLTTLHTFAGYPDGSNPSAALVQDTDGSLYGTASTNGEGYGTVFSLSVGLGPFVKTQPTGGKAGAGVKILGTSLTGASSVTFNGTPAAFTVEGSSFIRATVPAGATSGTVQVVTPSGTLSSNVPFRVAP